MFKKILISNLFFLLVLSCSGINEEIFLKEEIEKYFPRYPTEQYLTLANFSEISSYTDDKLFLETLYEKVKDKAMTDELFSLKLEKILFEHIFIKLIKCISDDICNNTLIIQILTQLNYKLSLSYREIRRIPAGLYKNYYKLLVNIKTGIDQKTLTDFIESVPNLKLAILGELANLLFFNIKCNYTVFAYIYQNIDENNYEKLLFKYRRDVFPAMSLESVEKAIENISYYSKLKDLLLEQ